MNKYIIGLDLGGTKIAAGAVDTRGKVIKKITLPTEARRGKKIILKNILAAASKVWLPGVKAVGVAMAGQCDFKNGVFVSGPNFPKNFKNIKIGKFLKENFRVPVYLDNDARTFTLAEAIFGAGRGFKNIIGITLGTGIGGGIVINGQLIRGKNNTAGELGHMTLDISSPYRCSCGRFGHFEALASGTALENFYKKLSGKFLPGPEIAKNILAKDKNAKQAVAQLGKFLGLGLANLAQLLDPDLIVIGGGLSNTPALWPAALQEFKKGVIYKSLKNTKIVRAKLKDDAGIIGAALLPDIRY
ncbi:ROK family protein [Candidatus Falkowbacteria bacterium]|nr:ROK family protein [Candidatus Falkowbacteria bacterium]